MTFSSCIVVVWLVCFVLFFVCLFVWLVFFLGGGGGGGGGDGISFVCCCFWWLFLLLFFGRGKFYCSTKLLSAARNVLITVYVYQMCYGARVSYLQITVYVHSVC